MALILAIPSRGLSRCDHRGQQNMADSSEQKSAKTHIFPSQRQSPSDSDDGDLQGFVPISQMNLPQPESSGDKFKRKMLEEPLVPFGELIVEIWSAVYGK